MEEDLIEESDEFDAPEFVESYDIHNIIEFEDKKRKYPFDEAEIELLEDEVQGSLRDSSENKLLSLKQELFVLEKSPKIIPATKKRKLNLKEIKIEIDEERVVVHLALDCFFVQVERKKSPNLKYLPVAIQQREDIISVSYEAKALNVKKHDNPSKIKSQVPQVVLVHVPKDPVSSKVSYKSYQEWSEKIFEFVSSKIRMLLDYPSSELVLDIPIEKDSIDEMYLDLTNVIDFLISKQISFKSEKSQVLFQSKQYLGIALDDSNCVGDEKLRIASILIHELRKLLKSEYGFTTLVGIGHNKMIAKLCTKLNRPNKQTFVFYNSLPALLSLKFVEEIPRFKSKVPQEQRTLLSKLNKISCIADIQQFSESELHQLFGKDVGNWLHLMGKASDNSPVIPRGPPKSINVGMSLTPFSDDISKIQSLLQPLSLELIERTFKDSTTYKRHPKTITFSYRMLDQPIIACSFPALKYFSLKTKKEGQSPEDPFTISNKIVLTCLQIFKERNKDISWTIRWIGLSIRSFVSDDKVDISRFLSTKSNANLFEQDRQLSPPNKKSSPKKKQSPSPPEAAKKNSTSKNTSTSTTNAILSFFKKK